MTEHDEQDTTDEALAKAHDEPIGNLDDHTHDTTPEVAVAESLRDALGTMREEADRIATLDTGTEQVEAAEQFAADAGTFDERVGAAARAADENEH